LDIAEIGTPSSGMSALTSDRIRQTILFVRGEKSCWAPTWPLSMESPLRLSSRPSSETRSDSQMISCSSSRVRNRWL
jgi:hypothetical protein